MCSDPEPNNPIGTSSAYGAILIVDSDGPYVGEPAELFKAQSGRGRICHKDSIGSTGCMSMFFGKLGIRAPKAWRRF